jgi:GntR family transcriptional repressor for pyruvate dehydrogenase complex
LDQIEINKVSKDRASAQIVAQLSALIQDNTLKPGQLLPGEYSLAKKFGVSRATIREALRSLETIGLIEISNGVGARITDLPVRLSDPDNSLRWLIERKESIVEIQEVREVLEGVAAKLCAQRITSEQLEILHQALLELENAIKNPEGTQVLLDANIKFHYLIGEYSNNKLLSDLILHFEYLYSAGSRAIMQQEGRNAIYMREHTSIFDAIAAHDGRLAETLMRAHINDTRVDIASLGTG